MRHKLTTIPHDSHSQLRLRLCQLSLQARHLPLRIQQPLRTAAAVGTRRGRRNASGLEGGHARGKGQRDGMAANRLRPWPAPLMLHPGTGVAAPEPSLPLAHRAEGSVRVRMRLAASSVRISCAASLRSSGSGRCVGLLAGCGSFAYQPRSTQVRADQRDSSHKASRQSGCNKEVNALAHLVFRGPLPHLGLRRGKARQACE